MFYTNVALRSNGLEAKRDVTHMRLAGCPYEIMDNRVKMATCDAKRVAWLNLLRLSRCLKALLE